MDIIKSTGVTLINSEQTLINLIKDIVKKENRVPKTIIAAVETIPPNLTVKYNGNIIPSSMIYCYDNLLINYTRKFSIDGNVEDVDLMLEKNDITNLMSAPVLPFKSESVPPPYSIAGGEGAIKGAGTYKTTGTIKMTDTLKVGDLVEVGIVGDKYIVRSKIIPMPNNSPGGA